MTDSISPLFCLLFYNDPQEGSFMKTLCATLIALALVSTPIPAHHSWPVNMTKLVTVKGTVLAFEWANPHPMITLEVQASTGKGPAEKWQIGGPALTRMEANGWTKTSLKPGDVITGMGYQFSDGQKIIRLEKIVFADGKELRVYGR